MNERKKKRKRFGGKCAYSNEGRKKEESSWCCCASPTFFMFFRPVKPLGQQRKHPRKPFPRQDLLPIWEQTKQVGCTRERGYEWNNTHISCIFIVARWIHGERTSERFIFGWLRLICWEILQNRCADFCSTETGLGVAVWSWICDGITWTVMDMEICGN